MRRLNVVVIPVHRESALEQWCLAVLRYQNTRPASPPPSILLLIQPLHPWYSLENLMAPAIHLLDMPYTSIGRKMCYYGALAQDIMIRFQAEFNVQLISYVEAEVELWIGVYAVVASVNGRIVYFGEGG
jgi:hypothetical protein